MPTPGQLQRWKSHQKQTRVKGAWEIANKEAAALAAYDPKEDGPYSRFRWTIQKFFSEKRKLLQSGVVPNL